MSPRSNVKILKARVRFLRRTLRDLEATYKAASDRGSFTPAVQAKAKAISVHDELEESLRLLAAAEEDAAPVVTDDAAIGMILKAIEGLPVSVLEQIRAAIDRQL